MGSSRIGAAGSSTSIISNAMATNNAWIGANGGAKHKGGGGGTSDAVEVCWSRGGRQFSSSREVYTRGLYRICLKFTTSEDEDEGKPEPATAFWTLYGRRTTIGNGVPNSNRPDDICRRMDDSMSGPEAGVLACMSDDDGEQAAVYAMRAGMTCGWSILGERGDVAVRVGKAKIFQKSGMGSKEARLLSLDAERWVLCDGASFAAGNSVFNVEEVNEKEQKLTIHCSKGPLRNKTLEVYANRCPYIFGRAHEADLCVMDRELSRKHGAILYVRQPGKARGVFVLADLESTVSSLNQLIIFTRVVGFSFLYIILSVSDLLTQSFTSLFPPPFYLIEWLVHETDRSIQSQGNWCTYPRRRIHRRTNRILC